MVNPGMMMNQDWIDPSFYSLPGMGNTNCYMATAAVTPHSRTLPPAQNCVQQQLLRSLQPRSRNHGARINSVEPCTLAPTVQPNYAAYPQVSSSMTGQTSHAVQYADLNLNVAGNRALQDELNTPVPSQGTPMNGFPFPNVQQTPPLVAPDWGATSMPLGGDPLLSEVTAEHQNRAPQRPQQLQLQFHARELPAGLGNFIGVDTPDVDRILSNNSGFDLLGYVDDTLTTHKIALNPEETKAFAPNSPPSCYNAASPGVSCISASTPSPGPAGNPVQQELSLGIKIEKETSVFQSALHQTGYVETNSPMGMYAGSGPSSQESYELPSYPPHLVESQDSQGLEELPANSQELGELPDSQNIGELPESQGLEELANVASNFAKLEPKDFEAVEQDEFYMPEMPSTSRAGMKRPASATSNVTQVSGKRSRFTGPYDTEDDLESEASSALDLKHRIMRLRNNEASRNSRQNRKVREQACETECSALTARNTLLKGRLAHLEKMMATMKALLMESMSQCAHHSKAVG